MKIEIRRFVKGSLLYDTETMEITENDCNFGNCIQLQLHKFMYLSKEYVKSLKYDFYIRMTKHKYFSITTEYEVIYDGMYYKIEGSTDEVKGITVNGKVIDCKATLDFIGIKNNNLIVGGMEDDTIIDKELGVLSYRPDDYVVFSDTDVEDVNFVTDSSVSIRDNKVCFGDVSLSFLELYRIADIYRLYEIESKGEIIPIQYLTVLNYLYGDIDIVYAFTFYTFDELYFKYETLSNGARLYPYTECIVDRTEYSGFFYVKDDKVYLIDLCELLEPFSTDEVVLCELDDGRLALLVCGTVYTIEFGSIYKYEDNSSFRCLCSINEMELKRRLLFG